MRSNTCRKLHERVRSDHRSAPTSEVMTGIAHLSTALLFKARVKQAPFLLLLVGAELTDLMWAVFNLFHRGGELSLERSYLDPPLRIVADLRLLDQPYSHSLTSVLLMALVFGGFAWLLCRSPEIVGAAVGVVVTHWGLDYLVHDADLMLSPWSVGALVPAMQLDGGRLEWGLAHASPIVTWLLQSSVALGCALAYCRSQSSAPRRDKTRVILVAAVFSLFALPMFVADLPGSGVLESASGVQMATVVECFLIGGALWWAVAKVEKSQLDTGLRAMIGVARPPVWTLWETRVGVRRLNRVVAVGCLSVGLLVFLESALNVEGSTLHNNLGTVLCLAYLGTGAALLRRWVPGLWVVLLLTSFVSPLGRVFSGVSSLSLLLVFVQVALGLVAVMAVTKLRRRDIQL